MNAGYQLTDTAEADLAEVLLRVADRDGVERALRVHDRFVQNVRYWHLSEVLV